MELLKIKIDQGLQKAKAFCIILINIYISCLKTRDIKIDNLIHYSIHNNIK